MVTIEVDGQKNECLSFRPLQRRIRGRLDLNRDSEPQSKLAAGEQPGPVPGQRIGFADGTGFVEESLHDDDHTVIRERLEAKGFRIGPKREEFEADETTWLFWIMRAVQSGVATVVSGKLPATLDASKARKNFITHEVPTTTDRLAAALERQNELFAAVLDRLGT